MAESANGDSVVFVLLFVVVIDDHKLLMAPRADVRAPPEKNHIVNKLIMKLNILCVPQSDVFYIIKLLYQY